MIRSRSGKGAKALFMAFKVIHSKSSRPQPKASASWSNSLVMEVSLISRLSVFTVTRKRSRRRSPMGCSAMEAHTPVFTLLVGHNSSGIRRSRTNAASRPKTSAPSDPEMSSTMRTP